MDKKERIFEAKYVDISPGVVQIVNEATSPFSAYFIPRTCLSKVSNIIQGEKIGIYFLFDENKTKVYVGQTENGIGRLQTHHQQEKFNWFVAIMFLADRDKWISIIDDLEAFAIISLDRICNQQQSQYTSQNKQKPKRKIESMTRLSQIESIFSEIKFWLSAHFKYDIESSKKSANLEDSSMISVEATRGGIQAYGLFNRNDRSIVVKAGSEVRLDDDHPANGDSIEKLRQEYKNNGKIKKIKGKYILQEDVLFDKLSPAAEFVIGGSCNGKTEWKSNGKTLKDLFKL
ncbi:DUF4357 domain-containing protein [Fibrobacter sp.]|uniref:DUF4357 domain-containing protein n=1 Tax=Fibrobacter sp. TaxID=35828 RepID=UPI00386DE225